jgi:RNA-directed DNA polymerase
VPRDCSHATRKNTGPERSRRRTRTKIGHLLALGVGKRTAILTGIISKRYWHLSRSKAMQMGMTNDRLKAQGLVRIRDLWMKAHGYA